MPANRPKCPYCGSLLAYWPARTLATNCSACCRPLMLVPASLHLHAYRILSVIDAARIAMVPLIGGAIVAFALGYLSPSAFAYAVSIALVVWGGIDVWDGTAGVESCLDRLSGRIRLRTAAKRSSISKIVFGATSIVLGVIGILMTK